MTTLKRFGDLKDGDIIRGVDGQPVMVRKAYDEHIPEKMYEIESEDGEIIKASGNHMWYVETKLDYELHRQRRVVGKKLLKKLDKEAVELLVNTATSEDEIETTLMDMITLCEAEESDELKAVLHRIAESIGHVAENNTELQDMNSGEAYNQNEVKTYDAKVFSQQILSLLGRKMKKRWPLIVGRIVTTEDIVHSYDSIEIPVMKSR